MNKRKKGDADSESSSSEDEEEDTMADACVKCQESGGDLWWSCDRCMSWYHPKCSGLPKKAQEALQARLDNKEDPKWTCQSCLESQKTKKSGPSARPWEWSKSEEQQMLEKFEGFLRRKLS